MIGKILDVSVEFGSGKGKVVLEVPKDDLNWYDENREQQVEIKIHKKKRTTIRFVVLFCLLILYILLVSVQLSALQVSLQIRHSSILF